MASEAKNFTKSGLYCIVEAFFTPTLLFSNSESQGKFSATRKRKYTASAFFLSLSSRLFTWVDEKSNWLFSPFSWHVVVAQATRQCTMCQNNSKMSHINFQGVQIDIWIFATKLHLHSRLPILDPKINETFLVFSYTVQWKCQHCQFDDLENVNQ